MKEGLHPAAQQEPHPRSVYIDNYHSDKIKDMECDRDKIIQKKSQSSVEQKEEHRTFSQTCDGPGQFQIILLHTLP